MNNIIEFIQEVGKLKRVKRAGWVREGVPEPESIADHIYSTTLICYVLADKLKVDKNKLIKMSLVHDIAESEEDIVLTRGGKIVSSPKDKFEKEKKVLNKLFSKIEDKEDYVNIWLEYERQESREAIILKQIDKLDMAFQALEYEKDINPSKLDEFWDDTRAFLKEPFLIEIFNELIKRRKKQ